MRFKFLRGEFVIRYEVDLLQIQVKVEEAGATNQLHRIHFPLTRKTQRWTTDSTCGTAALGCGLP